MSTPFGTPLSEGPIFEGDEEFSREQKERIEQRIHRNVKGFGFDIDEVLPQVRPPVLPTEKSTDQPSQQTEKDEMKDFFFGK